MRFSANEKGCSNSYTGTVRHQTKYALSTQLLQQKLFYTLFANTALKQINILDKTVLWKTSWMEV